MPFYEGRDLNDRLCKAVGVNPNTVYRVIIDSEINHIAKVITHGYVETDDGEIDLLQPILRRYELRPVEE